MDWRWWRDQWLDRFRPLAPATGGNNMLPVLIEVYAGFSNLDGRVVVGLEQVDVTHQDRKFRALAH